MTGVQTCALPISTKADLEIRWPNGNRERVENVAADRLVVVREGAGVVKQEAWAHRESADNEVSWGKG